MEVLASGALALASPGVNWRTGVKPSLLFCRVDARKAPRTLGARSRLVELWGLSRSGGSLSDSAGNGLNDTITLSYLTSGTGLIPATTTIWLIVA